VPTGLVGLYDGDLVCEQQLGAVAYLRLSASAVAVRSLSPVTTSMKELTLRFRSATTLKLFS